MTVEVLLAILGLIVALLIAGVAYWQGRPGQKAAKRELSNQPSLQILINGTNKSHILYTANCKTPFAYWSTLTLANAGRASLEDVTVQLDLPEMLYGSKLLRKFNESARVVRMERFVDPVDGTKRTLLFYHVPFLHPKVAYNIKDTFFIPLESLINSSVRAKTKDDVEVNIGYKLLTSWNLRVSVMAKGMKALAESFSIQYFDESADYVKHIIDSGDHHEADDMQDKISERELYRSMHIRLIDKSGSADESTKVDSEDSGEKQITSFLEPQKAQEVIFIDDFGFVASNSVE